MTPALNTHGAAIGALCHRYGVKRLDVFGSAARGDDFEPARSDIDLLVEFAQGANGLAGFIDLKEALETLLQRPVDLVDRRAVETSRNPIRRREVLRDARLLYVARV